MSSLRPTEPDGEVNTGRHTLPDAPRPVWKLDASAARGFLSLALAAAAGALVMVVVGWPRGQPVGDTTTERAVDNILVDASASPSVAVDGVVVDVDGKVQRPGVVELPGGSRVIDAIKAAGGVTRNADTGTLNLAELLIDGQQVVVPSHAESVVGSSQVLPGSSAGGATPSPGVSAGTVSINSATAAELEVLPGIGPVLAAAIVDWRTQNGGFTSIEQLQEVSGIGPATYAELAPLVRL
jgi:competence protein ComEA